MALPASSGAQGLPSDPEADSPSGVVYEIPVEKGRRDAAPRERVAPDEGGRVAGESETSIRSENNFGTSSEVPGVGEGSDGGSGTSSGSEGGSGGGSGGSGSGGSDLGSSSVEGVARGAAGSTAASADGPSEGVVYSLLVVLIAVGAAIGLFAGHRAHRGGHA